MRFDLANKQDAYNFHRGMPLEWAQVRGEPVLILSRRPSWLRRAWRRLMCWRVRPVFLVVTEVDVSSGTIVTESVPGRWSWLRWSWITRLP